MFICYYTAHLILFFLPAPGDIHTSIRLAARHHTITSYDMCTHIYIYIYIYIVHIMYSITQVKEASCPTCGAPQPGARGPQIVLIN